MPCPFRLHMIALALVAAILAGCEQAPTQSASPATSPGNEPRGVIVCMGDSLTAGYRVDENEAYPARLSAMLARDGFPYEIINAGVSGETSSGALARLDWVLTLAPDIVILETGANDGLRGVDPALTRSNIDAIVTRFQSEGVVVVLAGMEMVRNLGPVFTQAFRAIYPDIAETHGLILMPFFLEGVAGNPRLNQPDGIHPTAEGYRIVTANLYPYVREAIARYEKRASG
ncbi:MAG: arylesterase [Desulfobacterales bacterium]|nr:arylesterase [Desulfobacterales bacterium]